MNNAKPKSASQWITGMLGAIFSGVIVFSLTEGAPPKIFRQSEPETEEKALSNTVFLPAPNLFTGSEPEEPEAPVETENAQQLSAQPPAPIIVNLPAQESPAQKNTAVSAPASTPVDSCAKWQGEDPSGDLAYEVGRNLYYDQKNSDQALNSWRCVPKSNPNYAEVQRLIGYEIYCLQTRACQQGISYLEEAYLFRPNDQKILEDLGRAYVEVGRENDAIPLLEKANTARAQETLESIRS